MSAAFPSFASMPRDGAMYSSTIPPIFQLVVLHFLDNIKIFIFVGPWIRRAPKSSTTGGAPNPQKQTKKKTFETRRNLAFPCAFVARLLTPSSPFFFLFACTYFFAAEACRGGVGEPGSQAGGGSGGIDGEAVRPHLNAGKKKYVLEK